jgi:hypothetical protein
MYLVCETWRGILIQVNTAGDLRDCLLKDAVYITGYKYCGQQKYLVLADSVFCTV